MRETILVLDFGGQYTQLIAKVVRSCKVYSVIEDCNYNIGSIIRNKPKGIILSGGPDSVYQKGAPYVNPYLFELGIPILGICYGMQLTNYLLGGKMVQVRTVKEYGETTVNIDSSHPLFFGLSATVDAWMSHGDSVDGKNLPAGFRVIGSTENHVAAIANDSSKIYGVQFHPEVTHTPKGKDIISNFVFGLCGCSADWSMGSFIEESKKYILETVGNNDVICFVSGGVDSTFVASLLAQTKGIGNVHVIYIEALMRKDETKQVEDTLRRVGVKNLIVYKGEDEFIKVLENLTEPEAKRKAIGNLFGKIQDQMVKRLNLDPEKTFLAQGTLYTDLIESGSGVGSKAATIKSHHNVGCEFIDNLRKRRRLVEPNRLIFKDEVRLAAKEIGLPPEIYLREPFPGPGLGIRIVDANPSWVDESFNGISDKVSKIAERFAMHGHVVPVKTVGVQGDERTYSYLAVITGARDWHKIRSVAKCIPTEVHEVNRVVYSLYPAAEKYLSRTIQTTVSRETIDQLKEIDFSGRKIIDSYEFDPVSQTIFVLFGADINNTGKRSVALRAVLTDDFMTVKPIEPIDIQKSEIQNYRKTNKIFISWQCLEDIHNQFIQNSEVGAFVIDVTDKPPATTCWE